MVERYALLAVERHGCHLLRHYCVATAHAGEASRLRVAAELDGALLCAAYLVDRVRYVVVLDVRLVGCIVEDERVVSQRILHPLLQFCLREHGSRRVVRVAEVNHVYAMVGNLRYEAVLSGAWQIVDVAPATVFEHSSSAAHHVRVDIYWVNRVGDADGVVPAHNLADVSGVALCSVINEHFARVEMYAARCEVVLDYRLAQKVVAVLRPVTVERVCRSHLVYCFVHCLHHGGAQRLRHVAYAQTDDAHLRMRHLEGVHLLGYVCEQIAVREFQEMFINQCHTL